MVIDIGTFDAPSNLVLPGAFDKVIKLLARAFRQRFDRLKDNFVKTFPSETPDRPIIRFLRDVMKHSSDSFVGRSECQHHAKRMKNIRVSVGRKLRRMCKCCNFDCPLQCAHAPARFSL